MASSMRTAALIAGLFAGIVSVGAEASSPYVVFFDPAGSNLSPQAKAILDNFAWNWEAIEPADVEIRGHSDRRGPVEFNWRLSCARAAAARDYLVGRGVPNERIRISGWGELMPIITTADDVANAHNRRVEVTLMNPGQSLGPDEKLVSTVPLPRKSAGCLSMGGAKAKARP